MTRRQFVVGAGAVAIGTSSCAATAPSDSDAASQQQAMKTIGVLGGLGPQATMDFEARVHRVAQGLIAPHFNGGYPPMIVYYCRHAPFLVREDGAPLVPIRPDPRVLEAARVLGAATDFLVIPSNGTHLLQHEIAHAAGRPVLSMIDATVADVRRRRWARIGVLGLGDPVVYTEPLQDLGIVCETIGAAERAALDDAVFRLMEGRDGASSMAVARAAVDSLRERGVDGVLLGCTELPLLLRESADAEDLVNPAQLLAEVAVRAAMA